MKYKLTANGVIRDDGVNIPADEGNRDYREYLEWLAAGNTPDPIDPEPTVEVVPTIEERMAAAEILLEILAEVS